MRTLVISGPSEMMLQTGRLQKLHLPRVLRRLYTSFAWF
jgi:hypothetical protein